MTTLSNAADWSAFLREYAAAAGAEPWPGNPGASEEELLKAEAKLKVTLPSSYRTFLSTSNGWKHSSQSAPPLLAVRDLKWFRKEHKDWFESYQTGDEPLSIMEKDYFNYTEPCDEFDVKHLGQTLCISDMGDEAVVLLNPMVVWPDGEWETWFFANWNPGAVRYRSFADWMRHEMSETSTEPFQHSLTPGELPTVFLDPPGKPERRIRPREKVLVLEEVLAKLKSKKDRERVKAAQQLRLLGGDQAVAALLDALKNDPFGEVRREAAKSLGVLAPPEALEALIAAVDDSDVNTTAIYALRKFDDERSAQYLLKVLESHSMISGTAAHILGERKDSRAIKPLLNFLLSKTPRSPTSPGLGPIAGKIIANFQEDGFVALEPLMTDPDREVRSRAHGGISNLAYMAKNKDTRRKAFELLQRCAATETDEELRRGMEVSVQISEKKNRPTSTKS